MASKGSVLEDLILVHGDGVFYTTYPYISQNKILIWTVRGNKLASER